MNRTFVAALCLTAMVVAAVSSGSIHLQTASATEPADSPLFQESLHQATERISGRTVVEQQDVQDGRETSTSCAPTVCYSCRATLCGEPSCVYSTCNFTCGTCSWETCHHTVCEAPPGCTQTAIPTCGTCLSTCGTCEPICTLDLIQSGQAPPDLR